VKAHTEEQIIQAQYQAVDAPPRRRRNAEVARS
jgi:hypothetical protein